MANILLLCGLVSIYFVSVFGIEPQCNKFTFEEQLLEKMVRLEFKVENMFDSVTKSQLEIKNIAQKVEEELSLIHREKDQLEEDLGAHKLDMKKQLDETVDKLAETLNDFEDKMARLSDDLIKISNGSHPAEPYVTYIRWGRTVCPNNSATVYAGYASGSHYTHTGGPSNTICLPTDPQHGKHHPGEDGGYIYNSEFEAHSQAKSIFGEPMGDQDVPCAMCEVKGKSAILMIPARTECYNGWKKEYTGYLMTTYHTHQRSDLKCVDENPEKIQGQGGDNNGELFYFVEAAGTLPDPPYTRGVELTCVVCTK